jgi:hypothetical protein
MRLSDWALDPRLQSAHEQALRAYLQAPRLPREQWPVLMEAVDWLGLSTVVCDGRRLTFREFYETYIEARFADGFLRDLLTMADVEKEAPARQAMTARAISAWLEEVEGFSRRRPEGLRLLFYCLYWWSAFARGYAFEVRIFRDLTASGIAFDAHDLRKPTARRSRYDLTVLGLRGDVKYSTYFLNAEKLTDLHGDFFITRAFDPVQRTWLLIVVLTPMAWKQLNGDLEATTVEKLTSVLPAPAGFMLGETPFVVLGYDEWKQRVQRRQVAAGG